jgi:membrane protease YdiL (CAAX protease family)
LLGRPISRELSAVFVISIVLTVVIVAIGGAVPIVGENSLALVALVFLYLPILALRRQRLEPQDYGLTTRGAGRGLLVGLLFILLTLPPFLIGFHLWESIAFDHQPEVAFENYRAWPQELLFEPDRADDGLYLWRNQRNLRVDWVGEGEWTLMIEADGDLVYLSGPPPDQIIHDSRTAWTVTGPGESPPLQFSARGSDQLSLRVLRDGEPLETNLFHARGVTLPDQPGQPLRLERGLGWIAISILIQLLLVALPEEFFYRGYLQKRLEEIYPKRWSFGPFHLSVSNLTTSALFALAHFVVGFDPRRLSVFFPSLMFGWLRDRTGGLAAPIVYHAACNLMVEMTIVHYWPG